MASPQFEDAQEFVIKFGKYKGITLDAIASTDDGLKYLDWLRGQAWLNDPLKKHVLNYLNDPTINKELEKLL